MWFACHDTIKLRQENEDALSKPRHSVKRCMNMLIFVRFFVFLCIKITQDNGTRKGYGTDCAEK